MMLDARACASAHTTALFTSIVLSLVLLFSFSCTLIAGPQPRPGLLEYQSALLRPVRGGLVNLAGGNLIVPRIDLSIDTLFGTQRVGAHYNSATGDWTWSFGMTYDGSIFIDETGGRHVVREIAEGGAIPGTHWVRVDAYRIKTKGGLIHTFHPGTHRLLRISWGPDPWASRLSFYPDPAYSDGRLGGVAQCRAGESCTNLYTIARDANGCVGVISDRAGRRVEVESDAGCRHTLVRDPLAIDSGWGGRRFEYMDTLLVSQTNSEGERVEYAYARGQLTEVRRIGLGNPSEHFSYGYSVMDGLNTASVVDAEGGSQLYLYDMQGRLHARTDALGGETRWTWDGRRPSSHVDVSGLETRWEYVDDDPIVRRESSGNVVQLSYAPDVRNHFAPRRRPIARVEDSLGVLGERTYTATGKLHRITNGAGETTEVALNGDGLMTQLMTPTGLETRLGNFGVHGHPSTLSRGAIFEHRLYDDVGNRLEGEDFLLPLAPGRPGIVRNRFDANRNLAGISVRGGTDATPGIEETREVVVAYRSDGQVLRIARPYGGDVVRDYDALGRVVVERERVDGVWRLTTFEWDRADRLKALSRPNGMRREIDHDPAGRPIAVRLLKGGVLKKTLVLEYANGRLVARVDSSRPGTESLEYDAAGRIQRVVYPDGEVRESSYDLRSREIARRYRLAPGATPLRSLGFMYDGAGRMTALLEDGVPRIERHYQAGQLIEERFGNDLTRSYAYDATFGHLSETLTVDPENEIMAWTKVELTTCSISESCLLASAETLSSAPGGGSARTDEAHVFPAPAGADVETDRPGARLTAFGRTSYYDMVPNVRRNYAFDVLGNWLGRGPVGGTAAVSEFTFNPERNRVVAKTSAPTRVYHYDAAGFLMARDATTLQWDAGGRIERIGTQLEFEWDVLGRPVSRRVDGIETRLRFGGEIEADASGLPRALDLGTLRIDLTNATHRYRHRDFRGNVKMVTDDAGQPVLHYAYSPFGVLARYGSDGDTMSFAGGRAIGDFMLIGARLYDPEVGRFISPDPFPHAINAYAYTLGNPARFWDPDGLQSVPTPTAGVEGGGTKWFTGETANALLLLGTAVVAGSITTGNPVGTAVGAVIWGTGLVINAIEAGEATPETVSPEAAPSVPPPAECMCGSGSGSGGGAGQESSSESTSSASVCAPTAIAEAPIANRPLIALTLLHALAAAVWLERRRRGR